MVGKKVNYHLKVMHNIYSKNENFWLSDLSELLFFPQSQVKSLLSVMNASIFIPFQEPMQGQDAPNQSFNIISLCFV